VPSDMKRAFTVFLVVLVIYPSAAPVLGASNSQDYVSFLNSMDVVRMLGTIRDLTDDSFGGRQSGTQGATLASEYISNYFGTLGLRPAGTDGTYRAQFTMPLWQLTQVPQLTIEGTPPRDFVYRKDFSIHPGSDNGQFSADVVFAGYGITATDLAYDDFAGISASGKIVLVIAGTPPNGRFRESSYGSPYSKYENARAHHAVGLILANAPANPADNYVQIGRGVMGPSGGPYLWTKLTIFRGSVEMADAILAPTGKTLLILENGIDSSLKPNSLQMQTKLKVSVTVSYNEDATAVNVLGIVPGSDPAATQKVIIIGAHYDHLGRDADGSIFRGANDNGSGVAVMMEIAHILATGSKPKWTILFAAWSGEEEGLWGSWNYVNNSYFSLARTEAYINLDMVGCCTGLTAYVSEDYSGLRGVLSDSANALQLSPDVQGFSGGSDHVLFEENHVPNLMFIYEPLDAVYHTPADTIDHISRQDLLETGKLTALMALKLSEATVTLATEAATSAPTQQTTTSVQTETQPQVLSIAPTTNELLIAVVVIIVVAGAIAFHMTKGRKQLEKQSHGRGLATAPANNR